MQAARIRCDRKATTAADIAPQRLYITRPARPGFRRWRRGTDDRHDTFKRGAGPAPAQALFRCWHRGIREMDLIMGRFADATVDQLADDEMAEFEQLMEAPDRELLAWDHRRSRRAARLRHRAAAPAARFQPSPRAHHMRVARSPAELLTRGRPLTLAGVADGAKASWSPISPAPWRRAPTRRRRAS